MYCFVAVLADKELPGICRHVEEGLSLTERRLPSWPDSDEQSVSTVAEFLEKAYGSEILQSKTCLLAIAGILLGGCAASLSLSPDPGVNALMKGQVHVSKIRSSDDEDMYRAHYVVFARAADVWEMTRDLRDWIRTLEVVEDIQALVPVRSDEEADIFRVKWKRGEEQTVVIRRDELARKIEIAIDPDSKGVGRLGHCRIKVTSFAQDCYQRGGQ